MRCTMRFFSGSARLRLNWWQSTRAAVSSGASLRFAAGLRREMGERGLPANRSADSAASMGFVCGAARPRKTPFAGASELTCPAADKSP